MKLIVIATAIALFSGSSYAKDLLSAEQAKASAVVYMISHENGRLGATKADALTHIQGQRYEENLQDNCREGKPAGPAWVLPIVAKDYQPVPTDPNYVGREFGEIHVSAKTGRIISMCFAE